MGYTVHYLTQFNVFPLLSLSGIQRGMGKRRGGKWGIFYRQIYEWGGSLKYLNLRENPRKLLNVIVEWTLRRKKNDTPSSPLHSIINPLPTHNSHPTPPLPNKKWTHPSPRGHPPLFVTSDTLWLDTPCNRRRQERKEEERIERTQSAYWWGSCDSRRVPQKKASPWTYIFVRGTLGGRTTACRGFAPKVFRECEGVLWFLWGTVM